MQKRKYIGFVIIAFAMSFISLTAVSAQEMNDDNWQLTGQEVLLELSDPKGELTPGIYAWNPAQSPDVSNLRLLVEGGRHPVWSPHYQRIAYIFNGDIWISDRQGNGAAALPSHASEHISAESQVLQWAPDGKLYFTRQMPIWGSAVYVLPPMETATVKETRQLYNFPFNLVYAIRPLKKPLDDPLYQSIQNLTTFDWRNIQASNNASFSPDGQSVAMEIYPSGQRDLFRDKSHIQVYELISKALRSKELDNMMRTSVDPWFHEDAATPRIQGPGRSLLSNHTRSEILPLWSPSDKYIALTLVDADSYSMIPLIVNLDGTAVVKIAAPNFGEAVFGELSGAEWKRVPLSPSDKDAVKKDYPTLTVFRKAIAWSDNGKYLWVQEKIDGISVAKEEDGQWYVKQVKSHTKDTAYRPTMTSFKGNNILWFQDSDDSRKILNVHIFDAETGKTQAYSLRSALKVLSVDW